MNDEKSWPGRLSHPYSYKELRQRARELRARPTPAESELWKYLSHRQRVGFKFRRQHVINRFIVDFYCAEAALVIELDGEIHRFTVEQDEIRQDYLEGLGLAVLRFRNEDVLERIEEVLAQIDERLTSGSPTG